ncbi:MAG: hypothetical protein ACJ77Z_18305 [Thermoleophilaceae bacterium]
MRIRLALLAALAAAWFPAAALADDAPAPDQQQAAPAPAETQPAAPACLAAEGGEAGDHGLRGLRVGARARIRDADGKPLAVNSVSYCVEGGGDFSFALSHEQDIVLVLSTADGDSIGPINPTSPAQSARMRFPKMEKLTRAGTTTVYRVDTRRQLILGVAAGRVNFVAAADRLLLEYPNKLGYYMHRLGF